MKRKTKAFTIVELVIVIAVVAILAAVLIPVFSSIISKANLSSDIQLVKNLNTSLNIDFDKDFNLKTNHTMYDALETAKANGISVDNVKNNKARNHRIVWNSQSDRFVLINEADGSCVYFEPNTNQETVISDENKHLYFAIYDEMPSVQTYSIYASDLLSVEGGIISDLTVGFDAGSNFSFTELKYNRATASSARSVIFRTNQGTQCDYNGYVGETESDVIYHYGEAGLQEVVSGPHSFFERGAATETNIKRGHYVIESDSIVGIVNASAEEGDVVVDLKSGSIQGTVKNTNTEHSVTINGESGVITTNFEGNTEGGDLIVNLLSKPKYTNKTDMQQDADEENPEIKLSGLGTEERLIPSYDDVGEENAECISVAGYSIKVFTNCNAYSYSEAKIVENDVKESTYTVKFDKNGKAEKFNSSSDHTHTFGEPSWEWNSYTTATATFVCTADDCSFTEKVIVPTDRGYISGEETKSATCTEPGEKTYTAHLEHHNGQFESNSPNKEIIPAKGHTEAIDAEKPATCTETGLTEGKHCSRCNAVLVTQQTTPALGHNFENGQCTRCGKYNIRVKFANTDKYLYRVGNGNPVSASSLFEGNVSSIAVTNMHSDVSEVSGTYDETNKTISFTGTGVVKVTANDSVELLLEVVEAMNATESANATDNNVVLLNNIGTSQIKISNGYTFYGNGFKISYSGNGLRNAVNGYAEGAVDITYGGILDNAEVICKVFPKGYLYTTSGMEYIKETSNIDPSSDTNTRYKYQWSAVAISGDGSAVTNSHIYGARNNVYIGNGNVSLENCVLECGALANIQIISNSQSTVSLKDLTTVQYLTEDGFDVGNKMFGGAILLGAGDKDTMATEENPKIVVLGSFDQFNWVSNTESNQVSGSTQKQIANLALNQSKYSHNGYVNMGIVCLNNNTLNITGLPQGYSKSTVSFARSSGQVYSLESGYGTVDTSYNSDNKYPYQSSVQGLALPSIDYQTSDERLTVSKTPSSISIIAKLDAGDTYNFNFSDLSLSVGGNTLDYTVKNSSDAIVDKSQTVSLSGSGDTVYNLSATGNVGYNPDGTLKTGTRDVSIKLTISISLAETPAPEWTSQPSGTPIYVGNTKGQGWSIAVPILDGVKIKYWSTESNELKELDLSTISNVTKTTNNVLTISGSDYELELTSDAIKANKTNMWVMAAGKLYVTVSSDNDFVSTKTDSRSTTVKYKFKANSKADKPITITKTFSANKPGSSSTTYKYSNLTSGKLTELTSGGGGGGSCVAKGTLITMADGSQKAIEAMDGNEKILAWDFYNGCLTETTISAITNHGRQLFNVFTMQFSDGSAIDVVEEHAFYDADEKRFVNISYDNVCDYYYHSFVILNEKGEKEIVTLNNAIIEVREEDSYSIFTSKHVNAFANSLLTLSPSAMFLYPFEIDENMQFDKEAMEKDIERYGVLTYEEFCSFSQAVTEEQFYALNAQYMKIAIGKGITTMNDIMEYASILANDSLSK